jgi:hypothetical protein
MAPLQRKFKELLLRQIWVRDPSAVIAKYREAVGGDSLDKPPHSDASLSQIIGTILDREDADHSAGRMLRAIEA